MDNAADIKARIEAKRKLLDEKREAQEVLDLQAYEAALEEHGYDAVKMLTLPRYIDGLPTFVCVKTATKDMVKVHRDRVLKARRDKGGNPDPLASIRAATEVGTMVVVYPDKDTVDAIKEHFPNVYRDAGVEGLNLAKLSSEEEGKE